MLWETNEYPMPTQAKIVSACGDMHNFIHTYDPAEVLEPCEPEAVDTSPAEDIGGLGTGRQHWGARDHRASKQREDIARAMWLTYKQ